METEPQIPGSNYEVLYLELVSDEGPLVHQGIDRYRVSGVATDDRLVKVADW